MRALLPRCAVVAATVLTVTLLAPAAAQATQAEVDAARAEVRELVEDVEAATAEYEKVEARLASSQERVEAAQARVESQALVIAEMEDELAGLAVETFKRGGLDPRLTMLAGGSDFAQGTSTLTLIAERQSTTLTDLEEAQRDLEEAQAAAAAELAEVETLEADLAERRKAIEARLAGAKDALAVAEAENQKRIEAEERRRLEQASRARAAAESAAAAAAAVPAQAMGSGEFAMPTSGRISSPFGYRIHPILGYRKFHSGIDVAIGCGTPVVAAQDGVVESAGWNGSYGNILVVQHGGGTSTAYAHLEGFATSGGSVSKGQTIGYVGTTGLSTGCHLHFEVREGGEAVDPMGYL